MIHPVKGIPGMSSKKFLILCVLISLASHAAMLSLTGLINMRGNPPKEDVMTINLKDPPDNTNKVIEQEKESPPAPQPTKDRLDRQQSAPEETIDLGSIDVKYAPYLKKIKQKIESVWTYPQGAFAREEEGTTVVKFSISRSGDIVSNNILTSSGSDSLDQGTLYVVRSAAPYDPFPREIDLPRLNIIAKFHYRLSE